MPRTSASDRVNRWFDRHRGAVDATVAVTLTLLCMLVVATSGPQVTANGGEPLGGRALSVLFSALIVLPLAFRRVRPVLSVVLVYTAALGHLLIGIDVLLPADLLVLASLYAVTVHGPRWTYRVAAGGAVLGSATVALALAEQGASPAKAFLGVFVLIVLLFLATWLLALVRRSRHEQLIALRDRADRLEHEAEQQSRIAAAAERTRIAREMHDIVAHSLSVVVAQADGGRYVAADDRAAATRALATISETGRAALVDMRRLLGVLRDDGPDDSGPHADPRLPQPSIEGITDLVAQLRAAGMQVSLGKTGQRRELPPGAALTVYRVCQEALTNVMKHAGPGVSVSVMVMWHSSRIVLDVRDDGRGAAAASDGSGGHGVVGMRERAALFGGRLTAGPQPGGGYRVTLTVPLPEPRDPIFQPSSYPAAEATSRAAAGPGQEE